MRPLRFIFETQRVQWASRSPAFIRPVVIFSVIVFPILLFSIRSVPVLAQRPSSPIRSDGMGISGSYINSGERILRSPFGIYLPPKIGTLVESLASWQPTKQRLAAMTVLAERGPESTPLLIAALSSSDPNVRIGAIQILGWQQTPAVVKSLVQASYDPDPQILEAALTALGETGSWLALPRLQQAQIVQMKYYIQQAAFLAEQKVNARLAEELGLDVSELRAATVAPETGLAYAVTSQGLYERRTAGWVRLNTIPDLVTEVVATSSDGSVVYLGTVSGLFRSRNNGTSWEPVRVQVPGRTDILVTAVTVNPRNPEQVFVALASSALPVVSTPLGIYVSNNGGNSWTALDDSPRAYMTTRLSLGSVDPHYLFGGTSVGTWRYTLTETPINAQSD